MDTRQLCYWSELNGALVHIGELEPDPPLFCEKCNSSRHRTDACTTPETNFDLLTPEYIKKYDLSNHGNLSNGMNAPNSRVWSLDGKKEVNLLDFTTGSIPLVVNFGSYS